MYKDGRKYIATVTHGEVKMLQGAESDVSPTIPAGSHAVYMRHVDLDHSRYQEVLNLDECIVGPFVDAIYHHSNEQADDNERVYMIRIPHTVKDRSQWADIRIRRSDVQKKESFEKLQQSDDMTTEDDFSMVDDDFNTIYTKTFSQITCTAWNYTCNALIRAFLSVKLEKLEEFNISTVKVQTFICSDLYRIKDFRRVSNVISMFFKILVPVFVFW